MGKRERVSNREEERDCSLLQHQKDVFFTSLLGSISLHFSHSAEKRIDAVRRARERESRSFCSKHDRLCQLLSLPLAFAFEKERTFTDEEEEKEALKMSIKRCFRLWPAAHS